MTNKHALVLLSELCVHGSELALLGGFATFPTAMHLSNPHIW